VYTVFSDTVTQSDGLRTFCKPFKKSFNPRGRKRLKIWHQSPLQVEAPNCRWNHLHLRYFMFSLRVN